MNPAALRTDIAVCIERALSGLAPEISREIKVTASRNPDFGDLSCQVAMQPIDAFDLDEA